MMLGGKEERSWEKIRKGWTKEGMKEKKGVERGGKVNGESEREERQQ